MLRRPTGTRIKQAFTRALSIAFASSLAVPSCATDTPSRSVDTAFTCGKSFTQLPLDEVQPAEPVDFAAVRQFFNGSTKPSTRAITGTQCSTASDATKCEEALEATSEGLELTEACGMVGQCRQYLVTTAGDEVKRYTSSAEVLSFLGEIDTPADALVLLDFDVQAWVQCGDGLGVRESERGFLVTSREVVQYCPPQDATVTKLVEPDGKIKQVSREVGPMRRGEPCAIPGRRPEGLCGDVQWSAAAELGDYFASMAHFEAASVAAFEILALELAHHGAPPELVDRARQAARDELRHAALTATQAYRFGATPVIPQVTPRPLRSLDAIALDNATEGAVRETYSALLACHQAHAARDPQIAALMTQLAHDEIAHAALAFDIDAWIRPQLDQAAQTSVAAAQLAAVEALVRDCEREPGRVQREIAGLPDARTAREMCQVLARQLWDSTASA